MCEWVLHAKVVKPLAYTFLSDQGIDMDKSLAIIKRRLASFRDPSGSEAVEIFAKGREQLV